MSEALKKALASAKRLIDTFEDDTGATGRHNSAKERFNISRSRLERQRWIDIVDAAIENRLCSVGILGRWKNGYVYNNRYHCAIGDAVHENDVGFYSVPALSTVQIINPMTFERLTFKLVDMQVHSESGQRWERFYERVE